MAKTNRRKISDYTLDQKNINKGSEYGSRLLQKSMEEVGLGRSALADKNGVVLAGNKTVEKAAEMGIEDVIEVEVDGKTLVMVKRTDLDINSPQGAKMKILDNTVSRHNYVEDMETGAAVCDEHDLDPGKYGLGTPGARKVEIKEEELKPFKRTHVLLSFPPEKMLELQHLLQQITDFEYVEYEQSSN